MRAWTQSALLAACLGVAASNAFAGTFLAVGTNWGNRKDDNTYESRAVALRFDGQSWRESRLPATATGYLHGVTYSAPQTAWAIGILEDESATLLKSLDDGVSWNDVSTSLPKSVGDIVRPLALAFANESTGWILGIARPNVGPFLSQTLDGGKTWSNYKGHDVALSGNYYLAKSGSDIYLLRSDTVGSFVENLTAPSPRTKLGNAGEYRAVGLAPSDIGLWVVGARIQQDGTSASFLTTGTLTGVASRPGILPTATSLGVDSDLRALAFSTPDRGVAGGRNLSAGEEPQALMLTTADAGKSWQPTIVPDAVKRMTIRGITLQGKQGYAIATVGSAPGTAMIGTDDSGESWVHIPSSLDSTGRFMALTSSAD